MPGYILKKLICSIFLKLSDMMFVWILSGHAAVISSLHITVTWQYIA